jgi:prespore-specific regulator
MVANRQDAWTTEDDLLLAEVTLRHIREGSTQLAAFEEVAEKMGRTAAACGFRWNSTVRKKYVQAIALAKAQRQKNKMSRSFYTKKRVAATPVESVPGATLEEQISFDAIIRFLKNQKAVAQELTKKIRNLETDLKEKEDELRKLKEENERMKEEYSNAKTVSEDYKALVQIMDRARRIAIFGTEQEETPVFKMDPNGNLERIVK